MLMEEKKRRVGLKMKMRMKILQKSPSSAQGTPLEQHRLINRKKNGYCNYQHKITIFIGNFDQ